MNNNPYKFTDPDGEFVQTIFNPMTFGVIATGCALSSGCIGALESIAKDTVDAISSFNQSSDYGAGADLPSLDGLSDDEAIGILEDNGFGDRGDTAGNDGESRRKFYHPDGSRFK